MAVFTLVGLGMVTSGQCPAAQSPPGLGAGCFVKPESSSPSSAVQQAPRAPNPPVLLQGNADFAALLP